jgi:hypothetical protein
MWSPWASCRDLFETTCSGTRVCPSPNTHRVTACWLAHPKCATPSMCFEQHSCLHRWYCFQSCKVVCACVGTVGCNTTGCSVLYAHADRPVNFKVQPCALLDTTPAAHRLATANSSSLPHPWCPPHISHARARTQKHPPYTSAMHSLCSAPLSTLC